MKGHFFSHYNTANIGTSLSPTTLTITDPSTNAASREYRELTVVNDTDQDIKITFAMNTGVQGNFIVPKSIKGFTVRLCSDHHFDLSNIKANSMSSSSEAVGNVTFNFQG